jgi:hypothetical protein
MANKNPIPARHPRQDPEDKGKRYQRYLERHKESAELPIFDGGSGDDGITDCFGKYQSPDSPECQVCMIFKQCSEAMGVKPTPVAPIPLDLGFFEDMMMPSRKSTKSKKKGKRELSKSKKKV